ncbi:MAG: radical SAM protein [Oscillospiraceae bacterium]|nr:radical SAM protein [Oscillospiraceae bacterium]
MSSCNLCPRECGVDRNIQKGRCNETNCVYISRASLHMWEEPPISGENGSGTVFFAGCPLGCVYCQNRRISKGESGTLVTTDELAKIFLKLQEMGANNINLVTPTHYVPQIKESLIKAKKEELLIPIVYNTSGYEKVETLKTLEGLIDIYLPDFKYFSKDIAKKYSNAPDYFQVARDAIGEMYRQVGSPVFEDALMKKGMIIRHLILPGLQSDSKKIIEYLYNEYGDNVFLSIMNQYTPLENVADYPEINRTVTEDEYNEVVDFAESLGITNAFIQDGEAASESFIPDFENFNVDEFLRKD